MAKKEPKKAAKIRENIKRWDDKNKENVNHYHSMTEFIKGGQWEKEESKLFEDYKKIPLTVNKLKPLANHLVGEQRQNTPNLQSMPSDDVDEKTAEVREALVKEISLNSNARVIYQNAFMQAVIGGYSGFRIYSEYDNNESFDQNILIGGFKDPTKAFWDIGCESPCKTDGMFSGFKTTMSRKKFASIYGDKIEKMVGIQTNDATDTDSVTMSYSDENCITVIDYFERKSKIKTIYQLSTGDVIDSKEFEGLERLDLDGQEMIIYNGQPVTIINEREVQDYKIIHSKWAGDFRLEQTDFPSEQLPIIFLDQDSYYDKNGKQICSSFFKDAKDTQRYINYLRTQSAYLIKISRYDQFMASKQNVRSEDTQQVWRDPSVVMGALIYDESPNGNKPEQLRPPELSQSLMLQYTGASEDLQMTTGMYDTQMGEQGNEVSGAAIDARTRRGSFNTYIPFDSLNRAIACSGEIINEMIPKIYDTNRVLHLNMKDTGSQKVSLNQPMDDYGMQTQNDMTKGKFKIRLVPGPSFEGQKAQGQQSMDAVLSKNPELFSIMADLYVENLDMPNSIEIRNRLRTIVPPEIIEAGKTGKPLPPKPPQQDPMIALKQQELEYKMQQSQSDARQKQQELDLKRDNLIMESHQAGVDFTKELQKIETERNESLTEQKNQEMRYRAEMARIHVDLHKAHSGNIAKILTHQPNHFKQTEQDDKSYE